MQLCFSGAGGMVMGGDGAACGGMVLQLIPSLTQALLQSPANELRTQRPSPHAGTTIPGEGGNGGGEGEGGEGGEGGGGEGEGGGEGGDVEGGCVGEGNGGANSGGGDGVMPQWCVPAAQHVSG